MPCCHDVEQARRGADFFNAHELDEDILHSLGSLCLVAQELQATPVNHGAKFFVCGFYIDHISLVLPMRHRREKDLSPESFLIRLARKSGQNEMLAKRVLGNLSAGPRVFELGV